jgi:hypothetical protein
MCATANLARTKDSSRNDDNEVDANSEKSSSSKRRKASDNNQSSFRSLRQSFVDNFPMSSIRRSGKRSQEDIEESGASDHGEDWSDQDGDN